MLHFIYLWIENIRLSLQELMSNRLRSFLSLLGIAIGIFCIVAVFTAVDSIKKNLDDGLNKLGNNFIMIQKWPWAFGDTNYAWWKYWNRPIATRAELDRIKDEVNGCANADISVEMANQTIKKNRIEIDNMSVTAVTAAFAQMNDMEFVNGRFFNSVEENTGQPLVVLGFDIATQLNTNVEALVGNEVVVCNHRVKVIGVLKKVGNGMFAQVNDNTILIGYNFLKSFQDLHNMNLDATLKVVARDNVSVEELKDDIRRVMRSERKLRPVQEDNFAMNEMSILKTGFNAMYQQVNIGGFFIGLLSLLIGAFGIANIMFVSVRERTKQIGIKKAMGAKSTDILIEFLIEAIILSVLGGLMGVALVLILVKIIAVAFSFPLYLTLHNILIGVSISAFIGLIAGIIPAYYASRLDPVIAIRTT